jgi:chromosome segregation ATPase
MIADTLSKLHHQLLAAADELDAKDAEIEKKNRQIDDLLKAIEELEAAAQDTRVRYEQALANHEAYYQRMITAMNKQMELMAEQQDEVEFALSAAAETLRGQIFATLIYEDGTVPDQRFDEGAQE